MRGIPCLLLREKTAQSYQHARGNDGRDQREEREQVIACTMIEDAPATTGGKMASICQWGSLSGNISDAFAGVPCLTPLCRTLLPIGFPPSCCLRSPYPPSRIGLTRKAVEQASCASRIPGAERLSAHAQRATRER